MQPKSMVNQLKQILPLAEPVDYYFLLLRLLTIAGGVLWYLFIPHNSEEGTVLGWLLFLYIIYSFLLYVGILSWPLSIRRFYLATFGVDLISVSVLVRYAGYFTGSFFVAFYLLVAIHSYYFGLRLALMMSFLASIFYSYIYLDVSGFSLLVVPDLLLRLSFLFVLSFSLGLLAEREHRMRRKVENLNRELDHKNSILEQSYQHLSLGKLIGEIAEGLNEPCGTIVLRSQALQESARKQAVPQEFLKGVEVLNRASRKIAHTVKALLSFSSNRAMEMRSLNLNQLIEETLILMEKGFQEKALHVETNLDFSVPPILGDAYELKGVLINLLSNAGDAVSPGGTISVATQVASRNGGNEVVCTIRDDGEGVPQEYLDRIFSPFFTTKSDRGGIGLGLSSSLRVLNKHNGLIMVQSKPGGGSLFSLYLPFAGT